MAGGEMGRSVAFLLAVDVVEVIVKVQSRRTATLVQSIWCFVA